MFKKLRVFVGRVKERVLNFVGEVAAECKKKAVKAVSVSSALCAVLLATVFPTFASADPVEIAITKEQVEVILDYIVQNIAVIMPVGIAVMGIMIGIGLIPTIIKKFTNA